MDIKQFAINLTFAIIGLALTFGLVGLTVFMSHWYSLVNDQLIEETLGKSWKNVGLFASIFLTLSVVTAVLSFSFEWTIIFLGISGVLQIPAFILVCIIISYTTKNESVKKTFLQKFENATNYKDYAGAWDCLGLRETGTCNDTNKCCDPRIDNLVYHITTACKNWLIVFVVIWVVSLILLVPMIIFFCETGHKDSEN